MKAQALANVESAFKDQEDRRGTYDSCVHQDSDLQHSCEPPTPPLPSPPHPSPLLPTPPLPLKLYAPLLCS